MQSAANLKLHHFSNGQPAYALCGPQATQDPQMNGPLRPAETGNFGEPRSELAKVSHQLETLSHYFKSIHQLESSQNKGLEFALEMQKMLSLLLMVKEISQALGSESQQMLQSNKAMLSMIEVVRGKIFSELADVPQSINGTHLNNNPMAPAQPHNVPMLNLTPAQPV